MQITMSHVLLRKLRMVNTVNTTTTSRQDETENDNDDHGCKVLDRTESTAECDPDELVEVSISVKQDTKADDNESVSSTSTSSGTGTSENRNTTTSSCTSSNSSDEDKSGYGKDTSEEGTKQTDPYTESLKTELVELQHEVREKDSQCTILRETLCSMSVTMKNQAQQIKDKDAKIEEQKKVLKEKLEECEVWKEKYNTLSKDTARSCPPHDPLLADPALSVYTNRPRGQSARSNRSQFMHHQHLIDDSADFQHDGDDTLNNTDNEDSSTGGGRNSYRNCEAF